MTLPVSDDVAKSELSTSELEAISGGLVLTHGPNPPLGGVGGYHGGGAYHPPHLHSLPAGALSLLSTF